MTTTRRVAAATARSTRRSGRSGDDALAVDIGLRRRGGPISGAAIWIMGLVNGFATSGVVLLRVIGFGLVSSDIVL